MCWPGMRRLTADIPVTAYNKEGLFRVKPKRQTLELIHILSGTAMPNMSKVPVITASTRAQSPRRLARSAASDSDRIWWAA